MKNFLLLILAGIFFGWTGYLLLGQFKKPVYIPAPVGPTPILSTSTSPFVLPESAVKGWKVYVDDMRRFYFSYPPEMQVVGHADRNDLFLNDLHGNPLTYIDYGVTDYSGDLEKALKSWAGVYPEDDLLITNTVFEKLMDTEDTLGFLSRWQITRSGKSSEETEANFYSKLGTTFNPITKLKNRDILIFKKRSDSLDLDLFRQIVSTVRFYR
jgi:hypothetical protein